MIANFCHYIQENQDVRSKLSEPLKSSEISSDWNSYRNTSDACILIKKMKNIVYLFLLYMRNLV